MAATFAAVVQPSVAHRRPPPCRVQKFATPTTKLVQPAVAHRRPRKQLYIDSLYLAGLPEMEWV